MMCRAHPQLGYAAGRAHRAAHHDDAPVQQKVQSVPKKTTLICLAHWHVLKFFREAEQ